jgi:hypothetical protein
MRIILFLFLTFGGISLIHAQELELDTTLSANERIHKTYLPYYGSEFEVDLNYRYRLDEIAQWLKKDTTIHLHIRGHVCCGDGQRLSRLRAYRVYRFLLDAGAPPERLSFKGYSNSCPKAWPERTDEDEAMNRRVDFVVRKLR